MDIIIVGGGIGGLAVALALHQRGFNPIVYEAVPEVRELGVGINMLPHAMKELAELGLDGRVAAAGVATQELAYFNRHGQEIWSEPRGLLAGYDWPQISIHRGRLHGILYAAARERLGADQIVTGHRFTDFDDVGDRVTAQFEQAGGGVATAEGEILIAADGIHSRMRAIFHPDEGPPAYSGLFMWRAVSKARPYRTGASMVIVGHLTQRFVAYPIEPPDADGLALTNWIAHLTVDELLDREDWNRRGDPADFLPEFEDWAFDWLNIPAMIRDTDAVYEFPMVDRDPLDRWTHGRVTLLGDAAHPMYPIGSNGASQALLDARALADALVSHDDPAAALKDYESARLPATAAIVEANRGFGPEIVMQMVEDRAPGGFERIEDVIPREEMEEIASRYKSTAGFAKDQLARSG